MARNSIFNFDTSCYQFPEFDTSYWKNKDKDWVLDRKQQWLKIEPMLKYDKKSRGISAIKQYFMRGKLPDWDKMRDWNGWERHVDLFMFVWLHPSEDKDFLIHLRDQYAKSVVIKAEDIGKGYELFFSSSIVLASQTNVGWGLENVRYTGKNEFLFDVLMQDIDYMNEPLNFLNLTYSPPEKVILGVPISSFSHINLSSKWLCLMKMHPINEDFLYQYDRPLDWWYNCRAQNEDYFSSHAQAENLRNVFRKALYRIHNFNTQKEGDTCRTRFVHKIRKILDEREFISEFKQMWEDTKAGKIEVKDPWKR